METLKTKKEVNISNAVVNKLIEDYVRERTGEQFLVLGPLDIMYFLEDKTRVLNHVRVTWES